MKQTEEPKTPSPRHPRSPSSLHLADGDTEAQSRGLVPRCAGVRDRSGSRAVFLLPTSVRVPALISFAEHTKCSRSTYYTLGKPYANTGLAYLTPAWGRLAEISHSYNDTGSHGTVVLGEERTG